MKYYFYPLLSLLFVCGPANAGTDMLQSSFNVNYPEVMAVCESPVGFEESAQSAYLGATSELDYSYDRLKLIKKGSKYDITFSSKSGELWSASGRGMDVEKVMQDGAGIHMILKNMSGPEHFMFMPGLNGEGKLLWSSVRGSALTLCESISGSI